MNKKHFAGWNEAALEKLQTKTVSLPESTSPTKRKSKYNAIKTEIDGIVFDSKKEANRYAELKMLLMAKEISDLKMQVPFDLVVDGTHVCKYLADFTYTKDDNLIVEDVKGMKTAVYRLKKKLMKACHDIEIMEI